MMDVMSLVQDTTLWFRVTILITAVVNGIVTLAFEKIGMWYFTVWWRTRKEKLKAAQF